MAGKSLARVITPVTEKEMPEYCVLEEALTEVIASLRDPAPESFVLVTA
jgi:hypothetical protein